MTTPEGRANIKEVKEFFGMSLEEMRKEWKELRKEEQDWFKEEVGKIINS